MPDHAVRTFVGFGFGPIQTGLFIHEALRSGNFGRIVIAEVRRDLVDALRANRGRFSLNIADSEGVRSVTLGPVEILDPSDEADREVLVGALAEASEAATAVPSTAFYRSDSPGSIHGLLARGILRRRDVPLIVYAAENHTRAAAILREATVDAADSRERERLGRKAMFLDTVIGKMSAVIDDEVELASRGLARLTPKSRSAHLVESFHRILISRLDTPGATRGIDVFEERTDLEPFEEAKLYGHNAGHALAAYLAAARGLTRLAELSRLPGAVDFVRAACTKEAGAALCIRHAGKDALFTEDAFAAHVSDLITRMLNPHLGDLVRRVARDPARKLGWEDRLVGTMRLCLETGVRPRRFAVGAAAALRYLRGHAGGPRDPGTREVLSEIWAASSPSADTALEIVALVEDGNVELERMIASGRFDGG